MAVATEASVRTMLAAQLHAVSDDGTTTDVTELEGFWTPITAQATAESEAWLRQALIGFSDAAVAKWAMFEHYHRKLSLFWCGVYGAAQLTAEQRNLLEKLDCREEIMAVESIGPDDPDDDSDDLVLGGLMERDDDLFARPSVNSGGSIPGNVFNTATGYTWRDVR
jgi:hypothetical protein